MFDNTALKVLSYCIILLPSLDVISIYPLAVLTLVNNVYTVVFNKDTSQAQNTWTTWLIRLFMKLTVALLPIIVAMGVSNLVAVLNYTGPTIFISCLFVPTILQLRSQWVCKKLFTKTLDKGNIASSTIPVEGLINAKMAESLPLIPKMKYSNHDLYMTPYSTVFSHWPAVVVIGVVGGVLFILTVVSLFVPLFK